MVRSLRLVSGCLVLLLVALPAPALAADGETEADTTSVNVSAEPDPEAAHGDPAEEADPPAQEEADATETPASSPVDRTAQETYSGAAAVPNARPQRVRVAAAEAIPVVADDAYTVVAGGSLDVPAPGVLANDDPLPSGLHLHKLSSLAEVYGYLVWPTLNDDGSIRIEVPGGTAPGTHGLSYCMGPSTSQGSACTSNIAYITVTVVAPHVSDDAYTVVAGGSLDVAAPGVLANDDPLPPGLHLHKQSSLAEVLGYLVWPTLNDDGSIRIEVPGGTAPGTHELSYCMGPTASPGSACTSNIATIKVTVAAPVVADDAYTVVAGGSLDVAAPGVLANDDPLPPGLHLHKLSSLAEFYGYLVWPTLNDDGSIRIEVPATTSPGTHDLSYCMGPTASPGSACTSNIATIKVTVVAPVVADDAYTVVAGGSLDVAAPGVLANDDPLPPGLHLHKLSSLAEVYGYLVWPTLNDDGSIRIEVPATTSPGTHDLSYCMGPSTSQGSACTSNIAYIRVTVVAPHAVDDAYSVEEGDTLTVSAPGVLGNDEPGANTPGARNASTPAHGSVELTPGGGFTYTPDPGSVEDDSFTYELYDVDSGDLVDTATVTITVTQGLNAVGDTYETEQDTALVVADPGVLANDSNPNGNAFVSLVVDAQHGSVTVNPGGGFAYDPDDGFTGTDTFSYGLSDPRTRGALVGVVTIDVTAVDPGGVGGNETDKADEAVDAALPDTGSPVDSGSLMVSLLAMLLGLTLVMASRRLGYAYARGDMPHRRELETFRKHPSLQPPRF